MYPLIYKSAKCIYRDTHIFIYTIPKEKSILIHHMDMQTYTTISTATMSNYPWTRWWR